MTNNNDERREDTMKITKNADGTFAVQTMHGPATATVTEMGDSFEVDLTIDETGEEILISADEQDEFWEAHTAIDPIAQAHQLRADLNAALIALNCATLPEVGLRKHEDGSLLATCPECGGENDATVNLEAVHTTEGRTEIEGAHGHTVMLSDEEPTTTEHMVTMTMICCALPVALPGDWVAETA